MMKLLLAIALVASASAYSQCPACVAAAGAEANFCAYEGTSNCGCNSCNSDGGVNAFRFGCGLNACGDRRLTETTDLEEATTATAQWGRRRRRFFDARRRRRRFFDYRRRRRRFFDARRRRRRFFDDRRRRRRTNYPTPFPTSYPTPACGITCRFDGKHIMIHHDHRFIQHNKKYNLNKYQKHECWHDGTSCHCACHGTNWKGHGNTKAFTKTTCKQGKIAGTYSKFNTGKATGCEHRTHYLYDYKGSDCIWTSNLNKFNKPHSYKSAFVRFQVAEYGNLENQDHLTIELKFCRTTTSCGKWIKTVHMRDDILGWRWTTVHGAPVTGYYHYGGKAVKDWKNFYADMSWYHQYVQIRVTLHSTHNYAERHILDNMEVWGACQ